MDTTGFCESQRGDSLCANGVLAVTNAAAMSLRVATVGRAVADLLNARFGETCLYNVALTTQQVTDPFADGWTSFSRPVPA